MESAPVSRVGIARGVPGYGEGAPPWGPGKAYPELQGLLGDAVTRGAPSPAYAAVRAALLGAGLDAERFGSPEWNPLGVLVARGGRVVLKPNFIRHWNPQREGGSVTSVVTHGSVLRAVADYAFLAVGPGGAVEIAEAPQHDCDFERIREIAGLDELAHFYDETLGQELAVVDLRRETVRYADGVIVERRELPGDPRGYRVVDLGEQSAFHGSGLDPARFRGADYDPGPTGAHHRQGRNEYLLSETVLSADLVVNLPKLKTHKKTGVTLALKNLVGINGDKNWLPHHCVGSEAEGGDEYPGRGWLDGLRSRVVELARGPLSRGRATRLFRLGRRLEAGLRGDGFVRSGNWYRNRTTWRMCLDLARCFYYSDARGLHLEAPGPVRRALCVLDAIVAGEGEGPLAPSDRAVGAVLASDDPLALDLAAVRLMGFDERRIPKIRKALEAPALPLARVRGPADVELVEVSPSDFAVRRATLEELAPAVAFRAHSGWRGHIERPGAGRGLESGAEGPVQEEA